MDYFFDKSNTLLDNILRIRMNSLKGYDINMLSSDPMENSHENLMKFYNVKKEIIQPGAFYRVF